MAACRGLASSALAAVSVSEVIALVRPADLG
jgi:hypothetical protein